jgi:pimeloyl-ACP methyl ester carboxylesterase
VVKTLDGRVLACQVTGDPVGLTVFLLHGTPGDRHGPVLRSSVLYRMGVRLVSYDRPGYGESTRNPGRTVSSTAHDVEAIANRLGVSHFAVVGIGGGGLHALACAGLMPDRITRAAVLSPAGPNNIGMAWHAKTAVIMEQLPDILDNRHDIEQLLHDIPLDHADEPARKRTLAAIRAVLKLGPYGWLDDLAALRASWGFDLGGIHVPVLVQRDTDTPDAYTHIPHVSVRTSTARSGAIDALAEVFTWLIAEPYGQTQFAVSPTSRS